MLDLCYDLSTVQANKATEAELMQRQAGDERIHSATVGSATVTFLLLDVLLL